MVCAWSEQVVDQLTELRGPYRLKTKLLKMVMHLYRGGGSVLGISACHAVLDAESLTEVGFAEHKLHHLANCSTCTAAFERVASGKEASHMTP